MPKWSYEYLHPKNYKMSIALKSLKNVYYVIHTSWKQHHCLNLKFYGQDIIIIILEMNTSHQEICAFIPTFSRMHSIGDINNWSRSNICNIYHFVRNLWIHLYTFDLDVDGYNEDIGLCSFLFPSPGNNGNYFSTHSVHSSYNPQFSSK